MFREGKGVGVSRPSVPRLRAKKRLVENPNRTGNRRVEHRFGLA